MISSMTPFTLFHVILSLIGIFSGLVVALGLLTAKRLNGWTAIFLITTALTSITGFLFPFHRFLPSHALGIISVIVLVPAFAARYVFRLEGAWRRTYSVTAMIALYLNVFVLVAQLFMKVPALKALAPTQTEAPFKLAQLAVLLVFLVLTILATIRFRVEPVADLPKHPVTPTTV
jgi:uncharacterized membrane protein